MVRQLRLFECLLCVLQCSRRLLVAALMIALFVMRSRNAMCMGGKLVILSGSLVKIVWHSLPDATIAPAVL